MSSVSASHDVTWTIAYRKRSASRFQRVTNWSGTWAEAESVASKFGQDHPELQVWLVPSREHDATRPDHVDANNVLVDSGKRIKIVDNAPDLAPEYIPAIPGPLNLRGVETIVKAYVLTDANPHDGEQFDVAVIPNGDVASVMRYATMALGNPNWFSVTIEEIMPSADTCDHPDCDKRASYEGLRHEANAIHAGSPTPGFIGREIVPAHLRRVNVCGMHATMWGLWGYWDKPDTLPLVADDVALDLDAVAPIISPVKPERGSSRYNWDKLHRGDWVITSIEGDTGQILKLGTKWARVGFRTGETIKVLRTSLVQL